jgi:hypothetical protein
VTDPNAFATKVNETDDRSQWKSYDYVVVGEGALALVVMVVNR